ncbi:tyrosine-type recombinase/integrase [Sulfitobacter mediterraneus]|uniref:tyrosine-type recombinase/integrase n=1 Tax=Sulfitobacter mediterraneus TaxID=83219 RepID=UPI001931F834|nr:integrase arm-type DNA-binding domain-containing protein [Sulfitobacter mediterraneus]MBM1633876.1 tyrosine-type recombinase/integrase [Sulfitobacter mediterraneus]MBM1641609.1 tyrosine-type recombinase/integrase [Sulfitobacter mediterraneus]MBM1645740.1 tyrosine-type recombinase/integrase [Sulfitobacter mediterraneus]MBM1649728.1 tyrosine-type recombinase/integrase [Sulfitobacter mediterraneus]MBM1653809.1 tyrosine-type recombinase/integrase [Sulfitobacter mediterraneus]
MPLTDTALKNAKPTGKAFKMADAGGLYLLVTPAGSRLWRMKYRYDGREKLLSFGPYPIITLKKARLLRDEAKARLFDGQDPSALRKQQAQQAREARSHSFSAISDEYLQKLEKEGLAVATLKKNRWLLTFPEKSIGQQPISQIAPTDVLSVLREVENDGKYETARRLRSTMSAVFKFAIATGRASSDPTYALQGALITPQAKSRAALIKRHDIGKLLLGIEKASCHLKVRIALQLLALLAPRPGELRLAHWTEFDLADRIWRIPAERMKMRRAHRVPLSTQALELLGDLRDLNTGSSYLFPSVKSNEKAISENTLNQALRRMGYSKERVTAHGFRATFSTIANESGLWNADAIERALAHVEVNDVRRAYLRGEHWDERVRMTQWWADELDSFRESVR